MAANSPGRRSSAFKQDEGLAVTHAVIQHAWHADMRPQRFKALNLRGEGIGARGRAFLQEALHLA